MENTSAAIIFFVTICCLGVLIGNVLLVQTTAQEEPDDTTQTWLDFTGLITDVSAFVIIGFVGYIATKVNSWIKGNKEWKSTIEEKLDKQHDNFKVLESETRNNGQKLNTTIELLISDFKAYKEMQMREMSEISNDYNSLTTVVTEHRVEVKQIKEDIRELRQDLKDRNK